MNYIHRKSIGGYIEIVRVSLETHLKHATMFPTSRPITALSSNRRNEMAQ